MVLPASVAHDALDPAPGTWISQLRLSLRLSRAGLLLLVDRARPERLSELVRVLYTDHPKLEVLSDVRRAADAQEGSVLVLVPLPQDAGWLNLRRPLFSRLELKVVLWCDENTSAALARHAPDFFDWITQRQECPPGPVPHAVHGIRAAVAARAPGIVWKGAATEETKARIAETVAAAVPGWDLEEWIVPTRDYAALLDKLDRAKDRCAVIAADSPAKVRRTRWALAESKRSFPAIVVTELPMGGYFPVHADCLPLAAARARLEKLGAERPGCLAALSGMEPEAIDLIGSFLEKGVTEREIGTVLSQAEDPGAALAKLGWRKGIIAAQEVIEGSATAPVYRALEGSPEVVHGREKWAVGVRDKIMAGEDRASIRRLEATIEHPLRSAEEARRGGRLADAESTLRGLLTSIERDLGIEHPFWAKAQHRLAHVLFDAARYPEALSAIGAVFRSDTDFANDPALLLLACRTLAKLGRFTDAERALRHLMHPPPQTDAIASDSPGSPAGPEAPDDPILLHLLRSPPSTLRDHPEAPAALAETLTAQGRYEEARALPGDPPADAGPPEKKTQA